MSEETHVRKSKRRGIQISRNGLIATLVAFVLLVLCIYVWVKTPEWKTAALVGEPFRSSNFIIDMHIIPPQFNDFEYLQKEYGAEFPNREEIVELYIVRFEYFEISPHGRNVILGIDKNNRIVSAQVGVPK